MGDGPIPQFNASHARLKSAPLGIVTALPAEARCIAKALGTVPGLTRIGDTLLYVSGIGQARARQAAEMLVAQGARALLSWGTAGALASALRSGDVIVPDTIQVSAVSCPVDAAWRARLAARLEQHLTVHTGAILHTANVISTPDEKRMLFERTGALAVDMESAAVAQVARGAKIPFAILRAIVDPQTTVIPAAALAAIDDLGRPRIAHLLFALAREPRDLVGLLRLSACFRAALASLKRAAEIAGLSISRGE
ncbi:MAG: purine phosphorylase [Gammaproteobacteria bacterium]|nr:purine phosphorylase [Gammaproteobacteria bacterium]